MDHWIGVDLDGTLAHYTEWKGINHIGEPIPQMLDRINKWLNKGYIVKIFTARACQPESIPIIKAWLSDIGLGHLEITNVKDYGMIQLWDDRCVRVLPNKGIPCCGE